MRHLSLECRFEAWFFDFRMQIQRQMQRQRQIHRKWFLCPKCGIYLLNAASKRDFSISECKYKGKCKCKANAYENGFYALNAAFISWMPLRSVIFRFQNANTKAKCKCKGKCIGKWFLCPKYGIYLLNATSKRDFSISECKYKGKMQMQRQMHSKMVFMPSTEASISWMPLSKRDFSILECKYKGKMQMQIQRQMHRKVVLMP